MQNVKLTYEVDGLGMHAELIYESAPTPRPGVLVFPEAFGLGKHAIDTAERLAKLGYVALACDMHGDGSIVNSLPEVFRIVTELLAAPHAQTSRSSVRDAQAAPRGR